ncbi:glycosyltransferase [Schaalia sp. 19OD2882]|uniref:glycosyltransferase family 2 protein n=1 Tax=Schaalia sp. 19OD2882 TaxID=2794089 RepID=UPI0020A7FD79|nr:glycosyltransferase [Schaalia sp. 19OD2882]
MSSTEGAGRPRTSHAHAVAVVIPAHNVGRDIASTVRSCRAIPGVDLIIVVDDGSSDDTARAARAGGAVVVSHTVERGRSSAMETGVKVAAMRDALEAPLRHILFLSADLGESAVEASALVSAVDAGIADCAVGVLPDAQNRSRESGAVNLARTAIRRATGWEPVNPLAQERCLTREALNAAMPFSGGFGLEAGLTIDILAAGLSVVELPCAFVHLGSDPRRGDLHRSSRYADTAVTSLRKLLARKGLRAPDRPTKTVSTGVGDPYPRPAFERAASLAVAEGDEGDLAGR